MNNQERSYIEEASTNAFYLLARNLYGTILEIYKGLEDHDLFASMMVDNDKRESYILHITDYLANRFDEQMEEAGNDERLTYVNMNEVISDMRGIHIEILVFGLYW
ncbi:hypothetical protein ACN5QE_002946 [Cronobacter sakazakii]